MRFRTDKRQRRARAHSQVPELTPHITAHTRAIEALEQRQLLSIGPAPSNVAVPFDRVVIDANPKDRPLEKMLADINGDGKLDAVVGHTLNGGMYWYAQPSGGPKAGTWVKSTIAASGDFYEDMRPFDVNGDGRTDVIASFGSSVTWFQNPGGNGTGSWNQHRIGDQSAHDMVITDLDGDGKIDVATNNSIYFQNNPDSWTTVRGNNYSRTGDGVSLLDTGHGKIDLVGSGPSGTPHTIKWYENPRDHGGNARTDPWIMHTVGSLYDPNDARGGLTYDAADINGDGRIDIVTAQNEQPNDFATPPPVGIAWYEAPVDRANGAWTRHQIDVGITQVHKTRMADINGDGRLEIVYAQQEQSAGDRVGVLYNVNGSGIDWYNQVLSTGSGHNVDVGDVERDGDIDILNAPHSVYGAPKYIELWVNQRNGGSPTVTAPSITGQPQSQTVQPGQPATFTVSASGTAPLSYQWQRNGQNINCANGSSYTIASVTSTDNGAKFRAIVTNSAGSATSNEATLTVSQSAPPPPPNGTTYLSSLNPTLATNGWGPYERDRSNGEQGAADGRTITLNGQTFARGLGVHANSELRYTLGGAYATFQASIGIDDESGNSGKVQFKILGDGRTLFQSNAMTGASATGTVNVNVAGVAELVLIVNDGGDGLNDDHADWADARVTTSGSPNPDPGPDPNPNPGPGTPAYLSDLTPTSATNGWGPYERDRSNGEQGATDGRTITLNGKTYTKGLGVHANSDLRFSLNKAYASFQADIGIDDEVGNSGGVAFQVFGDGNKLYDSSFMTGSTATKSINIPVSGVSVLRLVVTDGGNNNYDDHGDWANARVA